MSTGVPEESNPGIFSRRPLKVDLSASMQSDLISQPHKKFLFSLQIESQFKCFQVFYQCGFSVLLGKFSIKWKNIVK